MVARGLGSRSCIPGLSGCSAGHGTNQKMQRCKEYLSPVSTNHRIGETKDTNNSQQHTSRRIFRNKDCMECELHTNCMDKEVICYNPFIEEKNLRSKKGYNDVYLDGAEFHNETISKVDISYDDIFNSLVKSFQKSSIPDSISMLINYGTDKSHILYDASHVNHHCSQVQIWDPFNEICRDVYCATNMDVLISCQGEGGARLVQFHLYKTKPNN